MTQKEKLDPITFRLEDNGVLTYFRKDGEPLSPENKEAVEKFLFHTKGIWWEVLERKLRR
jgi:hypothetical protein